MTSTRPFIESKKLAQAADEFLKQLKVCTEAWGRQTEYLQCSCNFYNGSFTFQTFFITQKLLGGHARTFVNLPLFYR